MRVLLPVDESEAALEAVKHALHLLNEGLQAIFVLATVQGPTSLYEKVLTPDSDVLERVTGAVGGHALDSAESLLNAAGVSFEREIGSGEPAPTLIGFAERHACEAIIP